MSPHSISLRTAASFESATSRLTEMILGAVAQNLAETLRDIAADIGLCHIAYLRLPPDKSADISLSCHLFEAVAAPLFRQKIYG